MTEIDNAELQRVKAEIATENQKRALRARLGLGFLLGAAVCVAAFSALMIFVVTPKTKAAIAEGKSEQAQADRESWQKSRDLIDKIDREGRARVAATQAVLDEVGGNGYTALIEPGSAGASPLQLFDAVRPGLGTLLVKLQAAQSSQISVRWVVPGHVRPLSKSAGYSYCWLSSSGEVDTANCPAIHP